MKNDDMHTKEGVVNQTNEGVEPEFRIAAAPCGMSGSIGHAPSSGPVYKKPRVRAPMSKEYEEVAHLLNLWNLNTICQEGACPNRGECWSKRHAAFMILGDTCTRACAFCNVKTGKPEAVDEGEPERVAQAIKHMGLNHVVITSVDRDDLPDGGAQHFANTIYAIRNHSPQTTIEILTPDFLRKKNAPDVIIKAKPDVFNHNLETIPGLYKAVRPGARYFNSLMLLKNVKEADDTIFTKSGLMVGLGEKKEEILQVMDDLREADVDFLTIGQYLQPTPKHYPVAEYVSDEMFEYYKVQAYAKGFSMVSCSALTRSSYHAGEDFQRLKEAKLLEKQAKGS